MPPRNSSTCSDVTAFVDNATSSMITAWRRLGGNSLIVSARRREKSSQPAARNELPFMAVRKLAEDVAEWIIRKRHDETLAIGSAREIRALLADVRAAPA